MRAICLDQVGPPENLKLVDRDIPAVGDDDILIRTELAGLIYADTEARRGTYYAKTEVPWYPGREVAGVVEKVGKNVASPRPGARVLALVLTGGCYAEYVLTSTRLHRFPGGTTAPAGEIIALPDHVTADQALPYAVNFRLAHVVVHAYSPAARAKRVIIHGASGGMGSMVTQVAHALGCEIFALCRNPAEAEFCRLNGADHCIDTTQVDYVAEVQRLTGGAGAHISYNGVGGKTLDTDPHALAPFGELILYGYVAGKTMFNPFGFSKSLTFKTFSADDFVGAAPFAAATVAMNEWFMTKPLTSASRIFDLADAPAAHRWIEEGRALGKIALRP